MTGQGQRDNQKESVGGWRRGKLEPNLHAVQRAGTSRRRSTVRIRNDVQTERLPSGEARRCCEIPGVGGFWAVS